MTPITNRYSIRADYRENLVQATVDSEGDPHYWNESRLKSAASYQWDVYANAARLVREKGFKSLLDVGCGPPVKLRALMPKGLDICLVDQPNTSGQAKAILPRATFFGANLEDSLPPMSQTFDLVLCADVIEHLVDPDPCLRFLSERVARDGLIMISTPERAILRGKDCTDCPHPMHVREWSFDEFSNFLANRGLELISHTLLPQQRTLLLQRSYGKVLAAFGKAPSWYSCQLAICRPRT